MITFSLMIGFGAALGLAWTARQSPKAGALRNFDAGFWALCGSLVGGRLAHVAAAWTYYGGHPWEIPQVWAGGLSGPGAAAGFLAALSLYAAVVDLPVGSLADALLPLALTLTVSAWLACWLDGTAYGAPAPAFGGLPGRDEWGRWALRWPVQLVGAALTLLIFWLLEGGFPAARSTARARSTPRDRPASRLPLALRKLAAPLQNAAPGAVSLLAFFSLSLEFLGLSLLRADPTFRFGGLRLDTWAWIALSGLAALAICFRFLRLRIP